MTLLSRLKSTLSKLWNRSEEERELEEEIRFHIEQETEENIRRGMKPVLARQAALKAFGGKMATQEDCRASWGVRIIDDWISDVNHGIRQVLKNKVHSLIIISTLAMCLGANTAAFNFFEKIVENPYEYREEDRIVQVGKSYPKIREGIVGQIAIPHFLFFKEQCKSFEHIAFANTGRAFDLEIDGQITRINTDGVTHEIWDVVGITPLVGRFFQQDDIESTGGRVVVLSEGLWNELKPLDSDMIGDQITLDGVQYEVLGVAPESFYLGMERAALWYPRQFENWEVNPDQRHNHSYFTYGKLKPGVSVEAADANLRTIYENFLGLYPEDRDGQERTGETFGAIAVNQSILQMLPQIGVAFLTIRWVTIIVLVIGCLNVGGMILVKGYSRLQEFAMRRALGASVWRLTRQMYSEIFLYFMVGGILSFLALKAAFIAGDYLRLSEIPWIGNWSIDIHSIAVTILFVVCCAVLTGSMPLLAVLKKDLMDHLKSGGRTASNSPGKHRMHAFFVISQVCLSVVLLVATTVLIRNLQAVLAKDIGFEKENRVAISIPQPGYKFGWGDENYLSKTLPFQERILDVINATPGVINASVSNRIPISTNNMGHSNFEMYDYQYQQGERRANALRVLIRPNYFETVGTDLLYGRGFDATDHFESEKVVILSQNAMERYYDGKNPVGKMIRFWGQDLRIVGVAEQVQDKPFFMDWNEYTLYFPSTQWANMNRNHSIFLVHVNGDPVAQLRSIESAIRSVESGITMDSTTFEEEYDIAVFAQELPMIMTVFFASIALGLSGIGLYGLVSFTVAERTKEYGIRMALGAQPSLILKRVLNGSGRLIAWGMAIGTGLSLLMCWKINPLLQDINTLNPSSFVAVLFFVVAVSIFASLTPAIRATRINVIDTLRYE